jgi:hypothetical protein
MRARIGTALGPYWSGIAQAVDVLATIAALGAIGSLPTVVNMLTRNTRLATKWLRRL